MPRGPGSDPSLDRRGRVNLGHGSDVVGDGRRGGRDRPDALLLAVPLDRPKVSVVGPPRRGRDRTPEKVDGLRVERLVREGRERGARVEVDDRHRTSKGRVMVKGWPNHGRGLTSDNSTLPEPKVKVIVTPSTPCSTLAHGRPLPVRGDYGREPVAPEGMAP